jgi:activator of HSP90 ATPase
MALAGAYHVGPRWPRWHWSESWKTYSPISNKEFARRLAEAPEEGVDDETAARILAAEAEQGENISQREMKRRLGL